MAKLRVGVLFGGRSTEHEVSVVSATTVLSALDPSRYAPVLIGVTPDGDWRVSESNPPLLPEAVFGASDAVTVAPSLGARLQLLRADAGDALSAPLDVIFPIIHGRDGEDGNLQGLFELAGIPYVGSGVLATAVCMDKLLSKRVLRDGGIDVLPALEFDRARALDAGDALVAEVEATFPYPVFVKPTCTGSSVGVSRAGDAKSLRRAVQEAAEYDRYVLIEPGVDAREIEVAVLGGHAPEASVPGEIRFEAGFYDYEAKYASDATQLLIPAELPETTTEELRRAALAAFRLLKCWGLARVDFFVTRDSGRVYLNELNTLPGFTDGSMYPRLWEASGIAPPALVDRLVELAFERQRETAALRTRFSEP